MQKENFTIRPISWDSPADREAAIQIRFKVFVQEQDVPADLELDEIDPIAYHVLALNTSGTACGTGRLFQDKSEPDCAHIGRMAVLKEYRGSGCGRAILRALIERARTVGFKQIVLAAQVHAIEFYRRESFTSTGDEYLDCNIPHQDMMMDVS